MNLLSELANSLSLPQGYVAKLAKTASHRYKEYSIPKRRGGMRVIHHPSKELKAIQRWLLRNIISGFQVHDSAFAYRKGGKHGIIENAKQHQCSRFLLRMDFENFFPSLASPDVGAYLTASPPLKWWTPIDTDLFCAFVCRHDRLTIGAPTSPSLSNALCLELDKRLFALAGANGVTYTRYADDLFFSTDAPGVLVKIEAEVENIVKSLACPKGLTINKGKTRHLSKRGRRVVTGIVLASTGSISLGHSLKRKVRALIHQVDKLSPAQRESLAGLLEHCKKC